jgi:hypothetical protein
MPSIHRLIKRLTKGGARVFYHDREKYFEVALAFPPPTITGRCWPEVLKRYWREISGF